MKVLRLKKRELNLKEFIKRTANESDFDTLIDEPTIIVDEDDLDVKIIYDHLTGIDTREVVKSLKSIRYDEGMRTRGLQSRSRIFGYRPRHEMRGDFCSTTSMAREHGREHAVVTSIAKILEEHYKKHDSEMYAKHKALTDEKVKKSYRINGDSVFTSGIINKNNPLKYHFDTGNFNKVFSCMIVFKQGIEGGYLAVPEYGLGFKLPNNSIFLFDGQGILHGVTPIRKASPEAHRFSVVYYSLKRMWQCLEIDEELARYRERKTLRERTRVENPLTPEDRARKEKNVEMLKKRYGKQ